MVLSWAYTLPHKGQGRQLMKIIDRLVIFALATLIALAAIDALNGEERDYNPPYKTNEN